MRLGKDAKVELIRKVPLFSRCSKRELREVAGVADQIDFPAGKELTREGAHGREFFVLLEGGADVRRKGRKIRSLRAGDFFGEIALISKSARTATVTTNAPTEALVITARSFDRLLKSSPEIGRGVLQALAERLAPELL